MQEANPAILSIPSFSSKLDPSFDMDVHKYYAEQSSYPSIAMTDPTQVQSPPYLPNDQEEMPYEKSFLCTVPKCGRAFRTKNSLRKHLETHTEEERAMILSNHYDGDSAEKRKKAGEAEYESYLCRFEDATNRIIRNRYGRGEGDRKGLQLHQKNIHMHNKPYSCPE